MDEHRWMDLAIEAGQLHEAMASRAPIEQAKGVLMGRRGCDAATAFAMLRQASMDHNVKVTSVTAALLRLVVGEDGADPAADAAARALLAQPVGIRDEGPADATA